MTVYKDTDFTALGITQIDVADIVVLVDVSDTTMDATGTNKQMTAGDFANSIILLSQGFALALAARAFLI